MQNKLLDKTFNIIELLSAAQNPLTLKEICRESGLPVAVASRILSDLIERGYVTKRDYHSFEPALGFLYLGQAQLSNRAFPRLAVEKVHDTLRRLNLSGALATLFKDQLVYLYHSVHEELHLIHALPYRCDLWSSNMAVVLCVEKCGEAEARRLLLEDLARQNFPPEEERSIGAELEGRIRQAARNHFSLWKTDRKYNLCFPVFHGGEILALAFYLKKQPPRTGSLFLECSRLAKELSNS